LGCGPRGPGVCRGVVGVWGGVVWFLVVLLDEWGGVGVVLPEPSFPRRIVICPFQIQDTPSVQNRVFY